MRDIRSTVERAKRSGIKIEKNWEKNSLRQRITMVGGRCDRREARSRVVETEDHDGGWSLRQERSTESGR